MNEGLGGGGVKERVSICNSECRSCEQLGTYHADIRNTMYYNARESLEVLGIRSLFTVTWYLYPLTEALSLIMRQSCTFETRLLLYVPSAVTLQTNKKMYVQPT